MMKNRKIKIIPEFDKAIIIYWNKKGKIKTDLGKQEINAFEVLVVLETASLLYRDIIKKSFTSGLP